MEKEDDYYSPAWVRRLREKGYEIGDVTTDYLPDPELVLPVGPGPAHADRSGRALRRVRVPRKPSPGRRNASVP